MIMELNCSPNNIRNQLGGGASSSSSPLRKMECLSCGCIVFPPVLQCKYWHSVCNFCRAKLETCPAPDCNESIDSANRSTVAEMFLEKHVIRCKYFKDGNGCLEAKLKEEADLLQAHETFHCHFRETKCLVPGCYKPVRFTCLQDHFEKHHFLSKFPPDSIQFNTSQMILRKQILNETCGERSYQTAVGYTVLADCVFLAIFRMTSLRLPVFEISSIVHPYYSRPSQGDNRCEIVARNEDDPTADFLWCGPVNQTYALTPILKVRNELGKMKWIVRMKIFSDSDSETTTQ